MSKVAKNLAMMVCLALGTLLTAQSALAQHKQANTFTEWAVLLWQTTFETPVLLPSGSHPGFDTGHVDCSIGQDGHVWFLYDIVGTAPGGPQIQRACSIPTGTALFFPLFRALWINFASDPPLTPQFCAESAQSGVESLGQVTITALLDGKPLKKNAVQFEQSPIFAMELPEPTATETNLLAFFGVPETEFPGWIAPANCDWGWYGYVEPLSVGDHVLKWKFESSLLGPLYDVRYDLTVVQRN